MILKYVLSISPPLPLPISYPQNDCLSAIPLVVAHLDFILLLTIIFIIAYLFYAFIYLTGRYIYDRLYPGPRWTANEDAGVTPSHKGFNYRRTLHDGPFDRGHHTLPSQRQHVKDTQNAERLFIEISDDSDSESVSLFIDSAF